MQLQVTGHITGIEARNGGWFAVAITEQGAQYPKKLSTKKPDLVQQAQQMMGQYITALYNESESSNLNPNSGVPYMNRYLEAIAMAGQGLPQAPQQSFQPPMPVQQFAPQQQPQFQPQPQQAPQYQPQPVPYAQPPIPQQAPIRISDDLREARIMRQSAAKVSVDLLQHLDPPDRNLASLVRIAEQLVGYFTNGVQWTTPPVQPQQRTAQQEWQADPDAHPNPGAQQFQDPGPQQGDPYHQSQGQALPDDGIPFAASIH